MTIVEGFRGATDLPKLEYLCRYPSELQLQYIEQKS